MITVVRLTATMTRSLSALIVFFCVQVSRHGEVCSNAEVLLISEGRVDGILRMHDYATPDPRSQTALE